MEKVVCVFGVALLILGGLCHGIKQPGHITFSDGIDLISQAAQRNTTILMSKPFRGILKEGLMEYILKANVLAKHGLSSRDNDSRETSVSRSYNVSEQCIADCETLLSSLGNSVSLTYASQMIDAAGKPPSNIVLGNTKWTGSYRECSRVEPIVQINATYWEKPFNPRYCTSGVISKPANSPPQQGQAGFLLAVCVPDSCSPEDVTGLINTAISFLPETYEAVGAQCQIKPEDRELDGAAIGVISVLALLAVLMICGSLYDLFRTYHHQFHPLLPKSTDDDPLLTDGAADDTIDTDNSEYRHVQETGIRTAEIVPPTSVNLAGRLLLCFSVFTNGDKLLSISPPSETNLTVIHGIRFLSMSWVILGHTYAFIPNFAADMLSFLPFAKRFTGQAILNATVSVDSFFVLSGVLAGYLLLREVDAKGAATKVSWWKYYFHRFWRLTPPYMLVMGAHTTLLYYMGEGPYWNNKFDADCRTDWWQNILYINNLFYKQSCMGWGWYLANDMQFFIISPLLLLPFFFRGLFAQIAGLVINFTVLLGSMIATGVIVHAYNFPASTPIQIFQPPEGYDAALFMQKLYTAPWCRIGPYIIGLMVGVLLHKTKRTVRLPKLVALVGWIIAAVMNMAVLYGLYGVTQGHKISPAVNAFYGAVNRNVWALGVGWVVFACATGHGGPVNKLLSWTGMVTLSRLTYMAYLIHPVVIFYTLFSQDTPIVLTDISMIYLFLGNLVISYGLSFVLSLAFEAPMIALEKVVLPR